MGLEPTTTGITIGKVEKSSALQNYLQQLDQALVCSCLLSVFPHFCPSVSRQCPASLGRCPFSFDWKPRSLAQGRLTTRSGNSPIGKADLQRARSGEHRLGRVPRNEKLERANGAFLR